MTSIQQQAAELLAEWEIAADFNDKSGVIEVGHLMAALLRQIASMGGEVEPVAWIEHHKAGDNLGWDSVKQANCSPLFTQQALDAAKLAWFEAGRRKGLEDAAITAWSHYMDTCRKFATGPDVVPDWCASKAIRELINKEA